MSDVLRFTNEYTIPTLIATLEATISALELFQKVVGAVAPNDSQPPRRRDRRGPLDDAGSRATDQLTRRLDDLRTVLSETNLPQDGDARDIVGEARSLTEEIEDRVRESRETADEARRRDHGVDGDRRRDDRRVRDDGRGDRRDGRDRRADRRDGRTDSRDDGPVEITVGSPDDADDPNEEQTDDTDTADPDETDAEPPEVDVEAELQSIKRDMGEDANDDED
ncbi:MAG: hypothetical protein J07HB67_02859 [halophilic archaeon J07HB67]|nr:MAG: hypothetical protein J07HB67_02859 [halophilic archaeon J07HB67]